MPFPRAENTFDATHLLTMRRRRPPLTPTINTKLGICSVLLGTLSRSMTWACVSRPFTGSSRCVGSHQFEGEGYVTYDRNEGQVEMIVR